MIVGNQLKKSLADPIKYSLGQRPDRSKKAGKKLVKEKRIKKHLSTFKCIVGLLPIEPFIEAKQNISINSILMNRPHSSLISYQTNNFKIDRRKKKRLSIDSVKYERESASRCSKKQRRRSKNSLSLQDQQSVFKNKLGQMRRRCNLSCNDMNDQIDIKKRKKSLKSNKRYSINEIIVDPIKVKKQKPLRQQKSKLKLKKSQNAVVKKGSTTGFCKLKPTNQKKTTCPINICETSKKQHKRKKSKKDKFIVSKDASIDEQYPIRKYVVNPFQKSKLPLKTIHKKKFQDDHSSNNLHKSKYHPLMEIDYTSCMNIFSASSGVLRSSQNSLKQTRQRSRHGSITNLDNKLSESNRYSSSINLSQIRYFQRHSPVKQQKKKMNIILSEFSPKKSQLRENIINQIKQQYPGLSNQEIWFLASVVLIQRKWRQHYFYSKIFKQKESLASVKDKQSFLNMKETRIHTKTFGDAKNNSESLIKEASREFSREKYPDFKKKKIQCCSIGVQAIQNFNQQQNNNIGKEKQLFSIQKQQNEISFSLENRDMNEINRSPYQKLYSRTQYYSLQRQVFPPISYLSVKNEQYKQNLKNSIRELEFQFLSKRISEAEFNFRKKQIQNVYLTFIQQIKKSKHDIKKGYLKYLQCIQKAKIANRSGLRRISSQTGFMRVLYEKIFQFDKQISNSSDSSQSLRRLSERYTIRKDFFQVSNLKSRKKENFAESDKKMVESKQFSQRMKVYNLESIPSQHSANLELANTQSLQIKQERFKNKQFSISREILTIKDEQLVNISQFLLKSRHDSHARGEFISELMLTDPNSEDSVQKKIQFNEDEVESMVDFTMHQLTVELHKDLSDFNTIKIQEISPERIQEQQQQPRTRKRSKTISLSNNDSYGQPQLPHLSPITTHRSKKDDSSLQIISYLHSFFKAIKQKQWTQEIVVAMNQQYGFSSLSYLKFLRDFQIPQDDYQPLISNEKFIVWESQYLNSHQEEIYEAYKGNNIDLVKQTLTIFHRCIFEMLMSELQKKRKYGEKGQPFPWEHSHIHYPSISSSKLEGILQKCLEKIQITCSYKCGIIDSKYIYFSQEELQRIHEQNEERIITMLEDQLSQSNNNWYELEEHMLEVRLEMCLLLEDILLIEVIRQIDYIEQNKIQKNQ